MRHSSILTCPKNLFAHLFLVTNAESPFLSPKFGNERRITISLAQIILIVTETYLYETFFSGKFAEFVYTLTSQVIDAHVLCNGIFCRCQMYQQLERETRRKETTDKNTDIYSN